MSWKRLVPVSLACTGVAIFTISLAFPNQARSQLACGPYAGQPCHSNCERECSDGSCCEWLFRYYQQQQT